MEVLDMTREHLGVLLDAKEKLCNSCDAIHCDICYVPKLIEKHREQVVKNEEHTNNDHKK